MSRIEKQTANVRSKKRGTHPVEAAVPAVVAVGLPEQYARTLEFCARLSLEEAVWVREMLCALEPPTEFLQLVESDPVALRLVAYILHPRASEPDVWRSLRPYLAEQDREYVEVLIEDTGASAVRQWTRGMFAMFYAVLGAQDAKLAGDDRPLMELVPEWGSHASVSEDGRRLIERTRCVAGGWITRIGTRSDDGSIDGEILLDDIPDLDSNEFREFADRYAVSCMQMWANPKHKHLRDTFFSGNTGRRYVMKLRRGGEIIAERPLHIADNYAGLVHELGTERMIEPGSVEGSKQEALLALFTTAMEYTPRMGRVPGAFQHRVRGKLTDRYRSSEVSSVVAGKRRVRAKNEVPTAESIERTDDGGSSDQALARAFLDKIEPRVTTDQREVMELIASGLSRADAARTRGVSRAAVTQMLRRIRARLASAKRRVVAVPKRPVTR